METKTLKEPNYEISIFEKLPLKTNFNIFIKLSKYNFALANNNVFSKTVEMFSRENILAG